MVLGSCRHLLQSCSSQFYRNCFNTVYASGSGSKCKRCLFNNGNRVTYLALLSRSFASSKQESYFSAIGGESDEPPPDLTAEQVTTILRTNERTVTNLTHHIVKLETNQLASNHPIEDRLRVSQLLIDDSTSIDDNKSLLFGVFDGHGGGGCVDVVSRRLYHYIALALSSNPKELIEKREIEEIVSDVIIFPRLQSMTSFYDEKAVNKLKKILGENERRFLIRYAEKLASNKDTTNDVAAKLRDAFVTCDNDMAEEIEYNLTKEKSENVVLHFYYNLAVSGCCANVILLHDEVAYVANTGDCKAVIGFKEMQKGEPVIKTKNLSLEHNCDNLDELKRIFAAHPPKEENNIIKHNRLLGQLMPLRAFGDFGYKWSVEQIKRTGLVRAYGPHVIPPHYYTPPYLICEPEVLVYDMAEIANQTNCFYVVLATDGLWEQFETGRHVLKQTFYHDSHDKKFPSVEGSFKIEASQISSTAAEAPLDRNGATHLLRYALGQNPSIVDSHLDEIEQMRQEQKRLVTFLTLPESVVRNFRDDISIIVLKLVN